MDADENSDLLEQHLKILSQRIRLDILKKISLSITPLSYSALQREVLGDNLNSANFAFHLKLLKTNNLIEQSGEGYEITPLGKKIVDGLISIEQILNEQNKTIMIRTSKYATEPFNLKKVETYLIQEGKMEAFHAKQIAKEVSERLSKTNIEYLTTPLMREYINGILLENGLEEVRHRLTRLGTPPAEAMKLFENRDMLPEEFLRKLGSAASEQFLLLNLLPKELADLYLSSEIVLLNLNTWSLKPLAFYYDSPKLLEHLSDYDITKINNERELFHFLNRFFKIVYNFQSFISEDFLIGNFDWIMDQIFQDSSHILFDYFISEIRRLNTTYSKLSLEFSDSNSESKALTRLLSSFKDSNEIPNIILNYSDLNSSLVKRVSQYIELERFLPHFLFNNNNKHSLLNSLTVDIKQSNNNDAPICKRVVLDKILLNLHAVALNSNKNDDKFEMILRERIMDSFKLFDLKQELINKKLKGLDEWKNLISNEDLQNSIRAISFFGLNEAVEFHCGIELDRTKASETFAINILDLMQKIIREEINETSNNYSLTQPHFGPYLKETLDNMKINFRNEIASSYSPWITRKNSDFQLDKQITIFNKLKNYMYGGNLFYLPKDYPLEAMEMLIASKINFKYL